MARSGSKRSGIPLCTVCGRELSSEHEHCPHQTLILNVPMYRVKRDGGDVLVVRSVDVEEALCSQMHGAGCSGYNFLFGQTCIIWNGDGSDLPWGKGKQKPKSIRLTECDCGHSVMCHDENGKCLKCSCEHMVLVK